VLLFINGLLLIGSRSQQQSGKSNEKAGARPAFWFVLLDRLA
jgi:hypothetical protein